MGVLSELLHKVGTVIVDTCQNGRFPVITIVLTKNRPTQRELMASKISPNPELSLKERQKLANKKYRETHKEQRKTQWKAWYEQNKELVKAKRKERYYNNLEDERKKSREKRRLTPEVYNEKFKRWAKENRKLINDYRKYKALHDPSFRIGLSFRRQLHNYVTNKKYRSFSILGCSLQEFKLYLESKFQEGMSWDNYGRTGWHIDHIRPCSSFDLTKEANQKLCFHYTNMQPLWAIDNIKKGGKYNG